jgi:hypothetical protein
VAPPPAAVPSPFDSAVPLADFSIPVTVTAGDDADTAFVKGLYHSLLGRDGDAAGVDAYVRMLHDGELLHNGQIKEQVVEKILYQHGIFRHDRFLVQFSVGPIPHDRIMRSIELFGTEVAPVVRRELAATGSS